MNIEMTLQEIKEATINEKVAKEALDQASKRLADVLDTKKTFDQRALSLFGGYMTGALAVAAVAGAVYKDHGFTVLSESFGLAALLLIAGAACFVWTQKDSQGGAAGSSPDMWLRNGVINGKDSMLPTMLAYVVYHHQSRIDVTINGNNDKAKWIRWGIYLGIASPIALILSALVLNRFS